MTVLCREAPFLVTRIVTETSPSLCGSLNGVTVVTLVTVDCWSIWGPSCHRHGERHGEIGLPKRLTRRRDGDDAHDGPLRAYSRQGVHLYFVGSLTPST